MITLHGHDLDMPNGQGPLGLHSLHPVTLQFASSHIAPDAICGLHVPVPALSQYAVGRQSTSVAQLV